MTGRTKPATAGRGERGGALAVLDGGALTLVEDLGRPGHAAIGLGRSGAADRSSFRLGARLLGQGYRRAALEVTFGGLVVRARGNLLVAITGAACPAQAGGREVGLNAPIELRDGVVLRLGAPTGGVRTYLSVRGGVAVPAVLGSRSSDLLSGLGPPPVLAGDVLPVGTAPGRFPILDQAPVVPPTSGSLRLSATFGPRDSWLADPTALAATPWVVSPESNRIGLRLEGAALRRAPDRLGTELPSEGLVRGAIQVPPNGQPVLFLSDHPVTGGYPVVAVVSEPDVDRAAQAAPGQTLRFVITR